MKSNRYIVGKRRFPISEPEDGLLVRKGAARSDPFIARQAIWDHSLVESGSIEIQRQRDARVDAELAGTSGQSRTRL